MPKRVSFALASLLAWVVPAANADVIYQYTGNTFGAVSGPYSRSDFVSITLELTSAVPANSSNVTLAPVAFSFSDGLQTLTQSNSSFGGQVSTDQNGAFKSWDLFAGVGGSAVMFPTSEIASENDTTLVQDMGGIDIGFPGGSFFAYSGNNPGTWTLVPEPSTVTLSVIGLSVIAATARRRRSPSE